MINKYRLLLCLMSTVLIVLNTIAQETTQDTATRTLLPFTYLSDTATTTISITNTLNEWRKTRYQMGGNTKRGIDCSHFTAVVYKNTYGKILSGSARDYYANIDTTFTSPLELKTGDMVFFNINGRSLSHVGVYVGNNEFVHATVHAGVIKSNLNEPYYTRYYKGGGRFNNLIPQLYTTNEQSVLLQNNDTNKIIVVNKLKHNAKKTKKHSVTKKKNSKKKSSKKQPKKTSSQKKSSSKKKSATKKSTKKKR